MSAEIFHRYAEIPGEFHQTASLFYWVIGGYLGGALRPIEQLQAIFAYRNAYVYPERVFFPGINDLLDESGKLKDLELIKRLTNQVEGFVGFVERLQGIKLRG